MDMWTHVLWFLAAAMAAWTAYRSGEAVGASRADDEIEKLEERNEALLQAGRASERRIYDVIGESRQYEERHTQRYRELEQRYWHIVQNFSEIAATVLAPKMMIVKGDGRGIPMEAGALIELGEPMTVAEADRQAARAQREAMEREELAALERERAALAGETEESFDGLEPVLIHDDAALPVQRVTAAEEGNG